MNYIIVCLALGLILLIHETGHFICARLMKIPIDRFSVGFGPKLWGFTRGETEYRISLIPLGGYVLPRVESEEEFFKISPARRIVFSLGGPLANLLTVIPLMAAFNMVTKGFSLTGLLVHPFLQTAIYVWRMISSIPMIFAQPQQLSGVIGIVSQGSQIISTGAAGLLTLTAFLSVNLAVLNLLPIPALDGGQIIMTAMEKLWPKSIKVRLPLSVFGWLLLISAMVYATTKDIGRLLG